LDNDGVTAGMDTGRPRGIIELDRHEEEICCARAFASEFLKREIAVELAVERAMAALVGKGRDILAAVKLTLIQSCASVAALYQASASDADIKRYAAFDINTLIGLGINEEQIETYMEKVQGKITMMQDSRSAVVFDHVKALIDTCLEGNCAGLKGTNVKDLAKRLPRASPYNAFFLEFLKLGVRAGEHWETFDPKGAGNLSSAITMAQDSFKELVDTLGIDAVYANLGSSRYYNIQHFLLILREEVNAAIAKSQESDLQELQQSVVSLKEEMDKVAEIVRVETKFNQLMKQLAGTLAAKQKVLQTLIDRMVKTFEAAGLDFKTAAPVDEEAARTAAGKALFFISLYTATVLYRSAFMGKQTKMGTNTAANLKQVLGAINANETSVRTERAMDLPITKELRKSVEVPLPAEPSVNPASVPQPVPTTRPATKLPPAKEVLEQPQDNESMTDSETDASMVDALRQALEPEAQVLSDKPPKTTAADIPSDAVVSSIAVEASGDEESTPNVGEDFKGALAQ
jgi:hypothetical protein